MFRYFIVMVSLTVISGCASLKIEEQDQDKHLQKFALAQCLIGYFDKKGYDTSDLKAISGGLVEVSDISLDKYQAIALSVKSYAPKINTKHPIDPTLNRCFYLDYSEGAAR